MDENNYITKGIGVLVIVLLFVWWEWSSVVNSIIRSDLETYRSQIRTADLSLPIKEHLLDAVEEFESHVDDGLKVGLFQWRRCDKAIRELLIGQLNADKARLVERELKHVERKDTSK